MGETADIARSVAAPQATGRIPEQRTAPDDECTGPRTPPGAGRPCRCGHDRDAHEHYRPGTECSTCDCARFRRVRRLPLPRRTR